MSGVGVGSEEMCSILIDNGQLDALRLILNDLKTKVGYVIFFGYSSFLSCTHTSVCRGLEVENRNTGKLPPAYGQGGMLNFSTPPGHAKLGTFTDHKLFASSAHPKMPIASGTRKAARKNINKEREGEDNSDDEDGGTSGQILGTPPPLPADINAALVQAVSDTKMAAMIEEWGMKDGISQVFRLFSVLVEPPTGLDLGKIGGLSNYLTTLYNWLSKIPVNGVRRIANRCFWIITGVFI